MPRIVVPSYPRLPNSERAALRIRPPVSSPAGRRPRRRAGSSAGGAVSAGGLVPVGSLVPVGWLVPVGRGVAVGSGVSPGSAVAWASSTVVRSKGSDMSATDAPDRSATRARQQRRRGQVQPGEGQALGQFRLALLPGLGLAGVDLDRDRAAPGPFGEQAEHFGAGLAAAARNQVLVLRRPRPVGEVDV